MLRRTSKDMFCIEKLRPCPCFLKHNIRMLNFDDFGYSCLLVFIGRLNKNCNVDGYNFSTYFFIGDTSYKI